MVYGADVNMVWYFSMVKPKARYIFYIPNCVDRQYVVLHVTWNIMFPISILFAQKCEDPKSKDWLKRY
jgi:hypothetical protein